MTGPVRVVVVDDDPEVTAGLGCVLGHSPGVQLVAAFPAAEPALTALSAGLPVEVVLVELGLPAMSGHELLRELRRARPDLQLVVFTVFGDDDNLFEALRKGAVGYILKGERAERIVQAVLDAAAGGSPMSPGIARRVLQALNGAPAMPPRDPRSRRRGGEATLTAVERPPGSSPAAPTAVLSPRELEVLELLAKGFTYEIIGTGLGMATSTVQSHIRTIYRKLDVCNKVEATSEGYRLGLLG